MKARLSTTAKKTKRVARKRLDTEDQRRLKRWLADRGRHNPDAPSLAKQAQLLKDVRLHIGFLSTGAPHEKFIGVLAGLLMSLPFQKSLSYHFRTFPHIGDNKLAAAAVHAGATHFLLLDDDTTHIPAGTIQRMLLFDKLIISPFVYNRGYPFLPNVMRTYDRPQAAWNDPKIRDFAITFLSPFQGLQPASLIPTQCTLHKMEVFEKIPFPWYHMPRKGGLQDSFFCAKAFEYGVDIWCDTDVVVQHDGIDHKTRLVEKAKHKMGEALVVFETPISEDRTVLFEGPPPSRMDQAIEIAGMSKPIREHFLGGYQLDYSYGNPVLDEDRERYRGTEQKLADGVPLPDESVEKRYGIKADIMNLQLNARPAKEIGDALIKGEIIEVPKKTRAKTVSMHTPKPKRDITVSPIVKRLGFSLLPGKEAFAPHLEHALKLKGDVAECGCFLCATSAWFLNLMEGKKTLHLFDTFKGLPVEIASKYEEDAGLKALWTTDDPTVIRDGKTHEPISFRPIAEDVLAKQPHRNYKFHEGLFSKHFPKFKKPLCFILSDTDMEQGTKETIELADRLLVPRGVIVFHDHANPYFPGVDRAIEQHLKESAYSLVKFPAFQLLVATKR